MQAKSVDLNIVLENGFRFQTNAKQRQITYEQICAAALYLKEDDQYKHRQDIFIACDDRALFVLSFFAALLAGKQVHVLHNHCKETVAAQVLHLQ